LETSGVFEAIHFRMMNHAAVLHALIVAAPDDFTIAHEHGADGDAARRQAFFRLVNRGFEK
jgi:hypothetical protein